MWNGGDDGYPWPHSVGPLVTYMGNCYDDCNNVDPASVDFFKIAEDDKREDGVWEQASLKEFNTAKARVPWNIAPGNYLIRHEIIALHQANEVGGCEFYPACVNVVVQGEGDVYPGDTVKFPGAYDAEEPGIYTPALYDSQEGVSWDLKVMIRLMYALADNELSAAWTCSLYSKLNLLSKPEI